MFFAGALRAGSLCCRARETLPRSKAQTVTILQNSQDSLRQGIYSFISGNSFLGWRNFLKTEKHLLAIKGEEGSSARFPWLFLQRGWHRRHPFRVRHTEDQRFPSG